MSMLSRQLGSAHDNLSLWQQRRNEVGTVWNDNQWKKMERVCNVEIKALLAQNLRSAEQLDAALGSALNILNRY